MSALGTPVESAAQDVGDLPATVIASRRALWRRMPMKTKVGALILGTFIVIAIIGPSIAPYDPSATIPTQAIPRPPSSFSMPVSGDFARA